MFKKKSVSDKTQASKTFFLWLLALSFLIILIGAFFAFDFKNKHDVRQTPVPIAKEQLLTTGTNKLNQQLVEVAGKDASINDLIKKLGKHIYLPTGRVTVTTIVDVDALRKENPIFYQFAKKGDRVVIYPTQAILYDPIVDLVLDVMHFSPAGGGNLK